MSAETFRAARAAAGLTQRDVAVAVGVEVRTVMRWESGASRPRNHNLLRLARLFRVDPETLA